MDLVIPREGAEQPPFLTTGCYEIHVAISSLSIGGAERIVVDWASRIYPRRRVHLIVLRDREKEWPVPSFVRITRLHGKNFENQLKVIGRSIAESGNPVCVCHLLRKRERDALSESGVFAIPVLHNAKEGWLEDVSCLSDEKYVIAVSAACAEDLRKNGWKGDVSVVRHIPSKRDFSLGVRERVRGLWNIPKDATLIGMIGAVKPQKNYPHALRLLKALRQKRDSFLAIVGGPVNTFCGRETWEEVVWEINRLGLRNRVAMPGFIPNAIDCLSAFDLILNTSHYEGLSIATLEALVHGYPVVASKVGGQGELASENLILVPAEASDEEWIDAIEKGLSLKRTLPKWADFPSHRLWTLAGLARPVSNSEKILFVTANLNSGGAQRSLVNLAQSINGRAGFEITVAGHSTTDYFYRQLKRAHVKVCRTGSPWNAFSYAEDLVYKISSENIGTVCFWNVDARIKLLAVKALAFTGVRFVDVSPGDYLFEEMAEIGEFQKLISFGAAEYFSRIDRFVLKYGGAAPAGCEGKTAVIPNGVPEPIRFKEDYAIRGVPRIAISGRIAPSKFVAEIVDAMGILWKKIPVAELHIFGLAEPQHHEYAEKLIGKIKGEVSKRIILRGQDFEMQDRLVDFDVFVVLGKNQGCPNALLEALSVGLPSVANDDGGTGEQLIHNETGLLIKDCSPELLADALSKLIMDRNLAKKLGTNGRKHVLRNFSTKKMSESYLNLLVGHGADQVNSEVTRTEEEGEWVSRAGVLAVT